MLASLHRRQQLQVSGCQTLFSSRSFQSHLCLPSAWRSCTAVRSMNTTACASFSLKPLENIQLSNTRYDTAFVFLTRFFVGFPCQKKKIYCQLAASQERLRYMKSVSYLISPKIWSIKNTFISMNTMALNTVKSHILCTFLAIPAKASINNVFFLHIY